MWTWSASASSEGEENVSAATYLSQFGLTGTLFLSLHPHPHHHQHRFDDFYFLTDPEEFIHSHFPDEKKWQLLDVPISLEEFERGVFKTSAFFSLGLQLIQPRHAHIVTGPTPVLANDRFYRMSAIC